LTGLDSATAATGAPAAGDPIRVLFILPGLHGGGAERTAVALLPHFNRRRFDVRLGLMKCEGPYVADVPPSDLLVPRWVPRGLRLDPGAGPGVGTLVIGSMAVPLLQHALMRRFRPQIVVSVMTAMTIAAGAALRLFGRRRVKWVAREGTNTNIKLMIETRPGIGRSIRRSATCLAFRDADALVATCDGVGRGLVQHFGAAAHRVQVIANPVDVERIGVRSREPLPPDVRTPFILGAGRLTRQKGFDILLRAYAAANLPGEVHLVLLGEGPERPALQALASELGIADRLSMPGFVENPWAYMARAAAFVLPSRFEGFASVIIEAMACGAPVIATDCDFGPREIVRSGESGLVVAAEHVPALSAALERVLGNGDLAARLARVGTARAAAFDAPGIAREYESLFDQLVGRTAP
jgi:glycosyltransferase involved in cell wall biosynthesis